MKKKTMCAHFLCGLFATSVVADDVYWANPVDGDWSDAAKWSTGVVPTQADNAFITVPGTYTVTLSNSANKPGPLVVGSGVAESGTQTLVLNAGDLSVTGSITVAKSGVVENHAELKDPKSTVVHIMDGGEFRQKKTKNWHGGRRLLLDEGGILNIADGVELGLNDGGSTDAGKMSIVNGMITGGGVVKFEYSKCGIDGTGTIGDVGGILRFSLSQGVYVGAGLTVNRDFVNTVKEGGWIWFYKSGTNRFNGNIIYTNGVGITQAFLYENDAHMTLVGTGSNYFSFADNGNFGDNEFHRRTGLTLAQSGETKVWLNGFVVKLRLQDFSVESTVDFIGDGGVLDVLHKGEAVATKIELHSPGVLRMSDLRVRLDFANNNNTRSGQILVNEGCELVWDNVNLEAACFKGGLSSKAVHVRNRGTYVLKSGSENSMDLRLGVNANNTSDTKASSVLFVGFDAGATIDVGQDASLRIANAVVENTMTNGWGFAKTGTLTLSTNVTTTALCENNGARVHPKKEPMFTQTLAIAGDDDVTVTMAKNGDKTVWYVGTLDLSGMSAGSTLELVSSGGTDEAIVYYIHLNNPNNVAFDASAWVNAKEISDGTVIVVL